MVIFLRLSTGTLWITREFPYRNFLFLGQTQVISGTIPIADPRSRSKVLRLNPSMAEKPLWSQVCGDRALGLVKLYFFDFRFAIDASFKDRSRWAISRTSGAISSFRRPLRKMQIFLTPISSRNVIRFQNVSFYLLRVS